MMFIEMGKKRLSMKVITQEKLAELGHWKWEGDNEELRKRKVKLGR